MALWIVHLVGCQKASQTFHSATVGVHLRKGILQRQHEYGAGNGHREQVKTNLQRLYPRDAGHRCRRIALRAYLRLNFDLSRPLRKSVTNQDLQQQAQSDYQTPQTSNRQDSASFDVQVCIFLAFLQQKNL